MNIRRRLYFLLGFYALAASMTAQTVKTIGVGQDASYTDHVALQDDSRDMDLMVKFVFNEPENKLTVSLISYRSLFVFREDTRYKMAVKCRRLRPERLPYIAEAAPGAKFKLTKDFRRMVPKPRKKYVFKRWIEYEGLQPSPMEYKMVNDYIEQTFDVVGKRDFVTLTLRDIIVMEKQQRPSGKPDRYSLMFRRDLNTCYQIQLLRNPCFGLEDEIAAAAKARDAIAASYHSLKKLAGSGTVTSQASLQAFKDLKQTLVGQYEPMPLVSPCPDIQNARDEYNLYADSIRSFRCVLVEELPKYTFDDLSGDGGNGPVFDVKEILVNARRIDNLVSRWVVATDLMERHDLETQCEDIIGYTTKMIDSHGRRTPDQQKAVNLFRAAENYYKKTCKGSR